MNGEFLNIDITLISNKLTLDEGIQPKRIGSWHHQYSEHLLGGTEAGYEYYDTKIVNVMDEPLSNLADLAVSTICTIIAARAKFNAAASIVMGLFVYAAQAIKNVEDYADEGNRYLSFEQKIYTDNNVNTTLAYYYKHMFKFYSKQNLQGTLIHTNTPIYELYYFI